MDPAQELQVQRKRELETREETTTPVRQFVPAADIYETEGDLRINLEMPGVEKENISVKVEDDTLSVEGRLDLAKYRGLQPLYVEYNIGTYVRSFRLSSKIDQTKITAEMKDGVLSLTLPQAEEAKPRVIKIG